MQAAVLLPVASGANRCDLCAAHPATAPAAPCMHWHHMLSCSRTPSMSACRHSTGGIKRLMLASKRLCAHLSPLSSVSDRAQISDTVARPADTPWQADVSEADSNASTARQTSTPAPRWLSTPVSRLWQQKIACGRPRHLAVTPAAWQSSSTAHCSGRGRQQLPQ